MVLTRSTVVGVTVELSLEEIAIADATTEGTRVTPAFALFIFIVAKPHTDCVAGTVVK